MWPGLWVWGPSSLPRREGGRRVCTGVGWGFRAEGRSRTQEGFPGPIFQGGTQLGARGATRSSSEPQEGSRPGGLEKPGRAQKLGLGAPGGRRPNPGVTLGRTPRGGGGGAAAALLFTGTCGSEGKSQAAAWRAGSFLRAGPGCGLGKQG